MEDEATSSKKRKRGDDDTDSESDGLAKKKARVTWQDEAREEATREETGQRLSGTSSETGIADLPSDQVNRYRNEPDWIERGPETLRKFAEAMADDQCKGIVGRLLDAGIARERIHIVSPHCPLVLRVDKLLSDDDVRQIKGLVNNARVEPSEISVPGGKDPGKGMVNMSFRKSFNRMTGSRIVQDWAQRLLPSGGPFMQTVVEYPPGGFVRPHTDALTENNFANRLFTLFVFLTSGTNRNDGPTTFINGNSPQLHVAQRAGDAWILLNSYYIPAEGTENQQIPADAKNFYIAENAAMHAGRETKGYKLAEQLFQYGPAPGDGDFESDPKAVPDIRPARLLKALGVSPEDAEKTERAMNCHPSESAAIFARAVDARPSLAR